MTERQIYGEGAFPSRAEYQLGGLALPALKLRALEQIDEILRSDKHDKENRVWYMSEGDLAIRSLGRRFSYTGDVDAVVLEEAEMLGIEIDPTYTVISDVFVSSQLHRSAHEREVADLRVSQTFEGTPYEFVSHYTLVQYRAGYIDAFVKRSDFLNKGDIEEYEMAQYDFWDFNTTLRAVEGLRRGIYLTDNESADVDRG